MGSVMVSVGGSKKKGGDGEGVEKLADRVVGKVGRKASTNKSNDQTMMVQKYRSFEEDLKWATRGLIGTMIDGAPIPLIQNKVVDAGFKDIDIIPLGADKVFVHSMNDINVSDVVQSAKQFFDMIFSSLVGWMKEVLPFQMEHGFVCLEFHYTLGMNFFSNYVCWIAEGF